MAATYTFHSADDHEILAKADLRNMQKVLAKIAGSLTRHGAPRSVYVHNGGGVVGAVIIESGIWTETSPDDYHQFATRAAEKRLASGITEE